MTYWSSVIECGAGMIGGNTATIITGISTAILGYLVQRPAAADKPQQVTGDSL
ncbi:hypothetical protein VB735_21625 [Halotia wernerae UHCC 0503]|nr:hypothetical protein [Halotia wernerae UHCC 0503]